MTQVEREPASQATPGRFLVELFAGPESRMWPVKSLLGAVFLCAWLPVAAFDFLRQSPHAPQSFFHDAAVQARMLVTLPLFLSARPLIEKLLSQAIRDLFDAGIVPPDAQPRVAEVLHRRAHFTRRPSVLLLFLVLAGGTAALDFVVARTGNGLAWREEGAGLSNAGLWYFFVSNPIYRLVVMRWLWGFVSWFFSMVMLARCVAPDPLHPDQQGGLERLTTAHVTFSLVLLGGSSALAGAFANQILFQGATFATIRPLIIATVVLLPMLVLVPLLPLVIPMMRARRRMLVAYGKVAEEQARAFSAYWFGKAKTSEQLRESPDFSALVDLQGSYEVALKMKTFPIQRALLIPLVLAVLLPMVPVAAIELPVIEVLKQLVSVL